MDKNYKLLIPKYMILCSIVICFILIIFKILNWNIAFLVSLLFILITTIVSNYLAKLWKTTSKKTTLLELFANKLFILILTGCFMFNHHILIIVFALELIMNIINIIFYNKTNKLEVLNIGKIKSCFIIVIGFLFTILMFINFNINIVYGLCYATINLEILTIINYIIFYTTYIKPSINDNNTHKQIMENKSQDLEKTIVLDELKNIESEIYDYEKDQF